MSEGLARLDANGFLSAVRILTFTLVFFVVGPAAFAADSGRPNKPQPNIKEALELHFGGTAKLLPGFQSEADKRMVNEHGGALLPELQTLYEDKGMRKRARDVLVSLAGNGKEPGERAAAILVLVRYRIKGPHYHGENDAWFDTVRSADFPEDARLMLREEFDSQLARKDSAEPSLIALIGASGDASQMPKLRNLIPLYRQQEDPPHIPRGVSHFYLHFYPPLLACARLGDKESIAKCIEILEALPDDQKSQNLETLSYVRQPEVVEYIKRFLFSDGKEGGGGQDALGMSYAGSATQALLRMLPDFPYRAPLEERRKWMSEQKQWNMIR